MTQFLAPSLTVFRSYTSALQTIALFGLKLHRFPAMLGALVFFILYVATLPHNACVLTMRDLCSSCVLIVPDKKFFVRSMSDAARKLFGITNAAMTRPGEFPLLPGVPAVHPLHARERK